MEHFILMDPDRRREIGRRSWEIAVERFSPETYHAALESLYLEALAEQDVRVP